MKNWEVLRDKLTAETLAELITGHASFNSCNLCAYKSCRCDYQCLNGVKKYLDQDAVIPKDKKDD